MNGTTFDWTTYWRDRDHSVLFHGTSVANWERIRHEGLVPSREGHTEGRVFFSTSQTPPSCFRIIGVQQIVVHAYPTGMTVMISTYPHFNITAGADTTEFDIRRPITDGHNRTSDCQK